MTFDQLVVSEGISAEIKTGSLQPPPAPFVHYRAWSVTLRYNGQRFLTDYFTPYFPPTAVDVLATVLFEAQSVNRAATFERWAIDCGYSTDSRWAYQTWAQIHGMIPKLKRFLGASYNKFVATLNPPPILHQGSPEKT